MDSGTRVGVRTSVCVPVLTLSNMNVYKIVWSIAIKFYLKHHWGGGKAALGFGKDRTKTLVSIGHRVIMGKSCEPSSTFIVDWILFILQVTRTTIKSRMSSKFGQIGPPTTKLAALERLKKSHILIMEEFL